MDIMGVLKLLPHRYPFLLVDRVLECRKGESIRAIKNVTVNEPFFHGDFRYRPVMPGVMSATFERAFKGIWRFSTVARVDGKEVASAEMMVAPETKPAPATAG